VAETHPEAETVITKKKGIVGGQQGGEKERSADEDVGLYGGVGEEERRQTAPRRMRKELIAGMRSFRPG